MDGTIVGIAIHAAGALVTVGVVLRAQKETDRRLSQLEATTFDHESRISTAEAKLSIAVPAKAGR